MVRESRFDHAERAANYLFQRLKEIMFGEPEDPTLRELERRLNDMRNRPEAYMTVTHDLQTGRLHSAFTYGPFDAGKEALEEAGYRIISLEELAGLRMQEGPNTSVSNHGCSTVEAFVFDAEKRPRLTKNSPIIANAEEATACHKAARQFYLNDEQFEKALANSVPIRETTIPSNRFGDDEITAFAFGEHAKAYGEFLENNGIKSINVTVDDAANPAHASHSKNKPFATDTFLQGLKYFEYGVPPSDLVTSAFNLTYRWHALRGVREAAS
jgi:hypothetical protein